MTEPTEKLGEETEAAMAVYEAVRAVDGIPYTAPEVVSSAARVLSAEVNRLTAALADRDSKLAAVEALCDKWEKDAGAASSAWEVFGPQKVSVPFAVAQFRAALSLSVPTSRTCSAGIGGGETCDLPDGHEGPHSSDGIPASTSPGRGFALPDGEVDHTPTMLDRPQFVEQRTGHVRPTPQADRRAAELAKYSAEQDKQR